ncbi:unnamed protein product [Rotaria sordida]|uniref:Uncharacterized protein n=1 Tax=Rotaria sordida TaxID=392033 RepID=A0A814VQ82_9BILA|nr:unnamed protein product [Rotaria sordida]
MTQAMQQKATDRIIQFAAEYDLQGTKYVSKIILDAIDAFFDFVLVVNRRSPATWNRLREDALKWGEEFFGQYYTKLHIIAEEIQEGISQKFCERHDDIRQKASIGFEETWLTPYRLVLDSMPGSRTNVRNLHADFINSTVEEEVIRPVLKQVINVKPRNILLDNDEQVFLPDFGTCQHGTGNVTVIGSRPCAPELTTDHPFSYDGAALDVFSLGTLMYAVAPKQTYLEPMQPITQADLNSLDQTVVLDSFQQLILQCVDFDPKQRPTASQVVQKLKEIADQVANGRPCLVCLDQPRYRRCLPCGHKIMCNTCLDQMQKSNPMPRCILCRQIFTSTQEDHDGHTYATTIRTNQTS